MTAGLSLVRATEIPAARELKVTVPRAVPPGVRHRVATLMLVSTGALTSNCASLWAPSGLVAEIMAVASVATGVVVIVKGLEVWPPEMVIVGGTAAAGLFELR